MYWVLTSERSRETQVTIDGAPKVIQQFNLDFERGKSHGKSFPLIEYCYTNPYNEALTDNMIAAGFRGLLVNSKIRAIFAKIQVDNIEYFDVELTNQDSGHVNTDYKLANIIGSKMCFDKEKSKFDEYKSGGVRFIDHLALIINKDEIYPKIFRMGEYLQIILVSNDLKQELEKQNITGIKLYHPNEYAN